MLRCCSFYRSSEALHVSVSRVRSKAGGTEAEFVLISSREGRAKRRNRMDEGEEGKVSSAKCERRTKIKRRDAFRGSDGLKELHFRAPHQHSAKHSPSLALTLSLSLFISVPSSSLFHLSHHQHQHRPRQARSAPATMSQSNIHVVSHPLISHHLANLRLADTSPKGKPFSRLTRLVATPADKRFFSCLL